MCDIEDIVHKITPVFNIFSTLFVQGEMKEGGWGSWEEVRGVAVDRQTWKASVEALCATWHAEDR